MKEETIKKGVGLVKEIDEAKKHKETLDRIFNSITHPQYTEQEVERRKEDSYILFKENNNSNSYIMLHIDAFDILETEMLKNEKYIAKKQKELAALKDE